MRKDGLDIRGDDVWFEPGASERRGAAVIRRELTNAVRREKLAQVVLWEGGDLLTESDGESLIDMHDRITMLTREAEQAGITQLVITSIHHETLKALGTTDVLELPPES